MPSPDEASQFESLYRQFGVADGLIWCEMHSCWLRLRVYDDGVWLAGVETTAIPYWGA